LVTKATPTSLVIENESILQLGKILNLVSRNNISLAIVTYKQLSEWLPNAHIT
jgi:hypothetical protein